MVLDTKSSDNLASIPILVYTRADIFVFPRLKQGQHRRTLGKKGDFSQMKTRALLLVSLLVFSLFALAGCGDEEAHPVLALEQKGKDFLSNWNDAVRRGNIDKLANMITEPFVVIDEDGNETVYAKADSFVEDFKKEVEIWVYENYNIRPVETIVADGNLNITGTIYYVRHDPEEIAPTGLPVTYRTNTRVELSFVEDGGNLKLTKMKIGE